ncbi:MAG TPA: NAD(+) diphosphatase [Burkholderiales bacterium]|nr:NAD(+) diphosphatase [Burkholderiales bacterium]
MMILSAPKDFVASYAAPEKLDQPALWFVYMGNHLLVSHSTRGVEAPVVRDLNELGLTELRSQYLGNLSGRHCFAAEVEDATPAPAGMQWSGLRALFGALDDTVFALAGRAFQIVDWDRSHQFCGRCGTATVLKEGERSRVCPSCAQLHYPRIAPAIMVLVRRGPEILLARSPHFPPGMFSALAGFTEPGETLEQTIVREVREEVSIEISNIRYFASQPWPFPHSLMIAFHADYVEGEIIPDPVEIEAADWFSLDRLPEKLPSTISISRRLIDATLNELKNGG